MAAKKIVPFVGILYLTDNINVIPMKGIKIPNKLFVKLLIGGPKKSSISPQIRPERIIQDTCFSKGIFAFRTIIFNFLLKKKAAVLTTTASFG